MPKKAMVLAAGLGTRLRPLTDTLPKPLVQVDGTTLIDHAIDRLESAGVREVVVNTHYLADQLEDHLGNRKAPDIRFSRETDLLDTGG
ncbi:MAG: NTP transferase domain-containing protein, partial [Alphaproteobacteria bacterium]|nr:NTP transferase domain-containing protein [Alphaproteobacteria bacterium]